MKKKILIIDESQLFRDYLIKKFEEHDFEVVEGKNGLDGSVKMRSEMPDLIVMDYYLSRKTSEEVLIEKKANPNISNIPVIIVASKVDKSSLVKVAKYNVKKFFSKPVKIDALLTAIGQLLKVDVVLDTTPCIIEAHLNDDILFVEIARGLNTEKIDLLKFKIEELKDLYDIKFPKVLLMMTDVDLKEEDSQKFASMLEMIIENAGPYAHHMKILTRSAVVRGFIENDDAYSSIAVMEDLSKAMDDLLGLRPDNIAHDEVVRLKLLATSAPKKDKEESFQLRFDAEIDSTSEQPEKAVTIGVVDDDVVIQQLVKTVFEKTKFTVKTYNNGKEFVDAIDGNSFDLVFLDLMMPEMNGFQVLEHLQKTGKKLQIIVLSALTKQETVVKALSYGVGSYMIKPFKPGNLLRKTAEILNANF